MKKPVETGRDAAQLIEQKRFTETLLNNLPGMAYRCANDRAWTMSFVSAGCEALTGHERKELTGTGFGWQELVHVDDRSAARLAVETALASRRKFDIQYRIIDKFGNGKWVREQGCGVYSDNGRVEAIEGYIDDISVLMSTAMKLEKTQKHYEEEVRQRHEQLAHADRLNTLGEMATGMAHEINQPLAAISLFAQTGRRLVEAGEYDKLQGIFDKLSQHSRRAGAIIERMQDMARRKESVRQIISLNALLKDAVVLAEVDARTSGTVIQFDVQKALPNVDVDVVQIQQVVLNLLRNGMDAMRSVGCRNGNTVQLASRLRDGGFLEVAVTDSGCGVPAKVAEHLFESFSTTKGTGLGMGLPISKAIVTAHGGQLTYRNNEGAGATFSFTLPAAAKGHQNG